MKQIIYNIIEELQKQNMHVRALSKILNINPMTLSRKIKELEKENVVDFREEGKNKVYFLKDSIESEQYQLITEHNKLIQIIKKHPRLRKVIEKIQESEIELAIIFGSYAKNTESKKSDIDLYIHTKDKSIKKKIELTDSKLSVKIGEFDVKNLLIKEMIKNHIIIKGVEKYHELIHQQTNI